MMNISCYYCYCTYFFTIVIILLSFRQLPNVTNQKSRNSTQTISKHRLNLRTNKSTALTLYLPSKRKSDQRCKCSPHVYDFILINNFPCTKLYGNLVSIFKFPETFTDAYALLLFYCITL